MPRAPPSVLALLLLLLAGCADRDGAGTRPLPNGTEPPDGDGGPPPDPTLVPAPEWRLGDWWLYDVTAEGALTTAFRMVVFEGSFEGDGTVWLVGADKRAVALHHAVFSVNPVLGRVTKDTLSPHQEGKPIRMFDFPLTDGKTWQDRFFSRDIAVKATYTMDIETPRGARAGYVLEAQSGTGFAVVYAYVPEVRWFTTFQVVDEKGFDRFRLDLLDFGRGHRGEAFFLRGHDLTTPFPIVEEFSSPGEKSFDLRVEQDFDSLGVFLAASTEGAAGRVRLLDPAGTVREEATATIAGSNVPGALRETPSARGTWTVDMSFVGRGRGEAWVVGIEEHKGTV